MPKPELLIFDCDGVLIDSEPIASRTFADQLQQRGIAISAAEAHVRFTGHSVGEIIAHCVEQQGLTDPDRLLRDWNIALFEEFRRSLRPMPGMPAVIAALRQQQKCVASNSTAVRLRASLGVTELWDAFTPAVFGADSVARPKPAPDLPLHCAAQFGVAPERCVMIDDSPHGVMAGKAAGMPAIGFVDPADPRSGRSAVLRAAGADFVVTGSVELGDLLASLTSTVAA